MDRSEIFIFMEQRNPDVLILGAGINGIGTYHDLALQGVDALLVDRGDFCSGASAASSRMAHGGIRYLENGEFRLVREAVQERNRLIRNAPKYVNPLPTTIPIFKLFSGLLNAPLKFLGLLDKPSERGGFVIKIGLLFYDAFTGRQRTVPRHVFLSRSAAHTRFPAISPSVKFTATYYDGLILSPERLALEILMDSERQGNHVRSLNYVSLGGMQGGAVILSDDVSGRLQAIRPKVIINATGPWIDRTNRLLGLQTEYIGPTKGSHLVIDNPELHAAIQGNEFFFENKDGRIVLILPMFDKTMIGTSDLPIEDPDTSRCTELEVDYFLEMVAKVFPGIRVKREQIIYRFSGVRPLAKTSARNAGQITRDHHIQVDSLNGIPVLSLVGGKWTSFRAFSEQVTDRVLKILERSRIRDTRDLLIGNVQDQNGIKTDPKYSASEITRIVKEEKVVHLDDFILRRTLLAYLGQLSRAILDEISKTIASCLSWDEQTRLMEVDRTLDLLADRHGVSLQ